jgi:hypothetical protein
VWVVPGTAYVALEAAEHFVVKGTSGGVSDITQNFTLPFTALVPAVVRDFRLMSWTHPVGFQNSATGSAWEPTRPVHTR